MSKFIPVAIAITATTATLIVAISSARAELSRPVAGSHAEVAAAAEAKVW